MSLKSLSLKSIATVPPFIPPSLLSNGRVPQPTLPVPDMIEAILVDGSPWSSRRRHGGHPRLSINRGAFTLASNSRAMVPCGCTVIFGVT